MTLPRVEPAGILDRYRSDRHGLFDLASMPGRPDATSAAGTTTAPTGTFDELLDGAGALRGQWAELIDGYERLGDDGLRQADRRVRTLVDDDGITYNAPAGAGTQQRRWQLDCVPLLVDGARWQELEKGIAQRARVLDALLSDIYSDQRTITAGVLPPEMVYGHPGYIRKAARFPQTQPHSLFLHACDIGRAADGEHLVFADRAQAPSGIGYAIADRRLMSRAFPRLFQRCVPRPTAAFAATLRLALFEYAPQGIEDPTVAVLTPGSLSETAFDQAYLASILGFPLVEAADLVVRDGAVYMRSLGKFKRLDVILRRVDSSYSDPLDLRTDSRLGVTGLVEAISRGAVTVLNTLGSAVVENPALNTVLAAAGRYLLDEDLLLNSVETYWAGDDLQRSKLLAELSDMTVTNFRTGEETLGPMLSAGDSSALAAQIESEPWQWVGRRLTPFSVAPSTTPGPFRQSVLGSPLRAAPVGIRAFSVAQGSGYAVMPGGLGHVLADGPAGSAMTSIAGKDVWVTTVEPAGTQSRVPDSPDRPVRDATIAVSPGASAATRRGTDAAVVSSPRVLSDLFWFGRYGERAELTTRMVRVARERYEDYRYRPWMTGTASIPLFLAAVATSTGTGGIVRGAKNIGDVSGEGAPEPDEVEAATLRLHAMTSARRSPGSVAFAVDRMQQLARAVRDQLSTSTWMVLGAVDRALTELGPQPALDIAADELDLDGSGLGRAQDDILHGLLALAGLQAESMVHDAGWLFMDIGRRIERAQMLASLTAAVLVTQRDADTEQGLLEAYLVANESAIIYRRRNRGIVRLGSVAALMLFDEGNPRAMIYQLATLRDDLTSLPTDVRSAAAERVVEDLVSELRRVDPVDLAAIGSGGRRVELDELMRTLNSGLREISDVLGRTRFAYPVEMQPLWGAGSEVQL
ncbi:putative circularly permuted ATP-grasp superfamily protein [Williamsia limnetica]|uniref:Putative circularly permuted ATP-grasp superfamily protein n=2 Tax=Williamsia limnetica TaxID=882452 RepID=A0A318S2Y1_WILLI|nr:putative circularly permuted ATP-grasp superfamily protein [Williamsia limnetica]